MSRAICGVRIGACLGRVLLVSALLAGAASFPPAGAEQASTNPKQVVPLSADALYSGWRASDVLGHKAVTTSGQELGTVRNLLVGSDGGLEALVLQGGGVSNAKEFIFRVPWQTVDATRLPDHVIITVSDGGRPEYGIFPGARGIPDVPNEFPVTHVIGDYARLQAGQGYGYVSDVAFTRRGDMLAVLVTRDATAGGGIYAFGFPRSPVPRWDPSTGYYGLPYVTARQADEAAVRVQSSRFNGPKSDDG
jgi:sporulation protein YlmC with PRC-barrel domain